VSSSDDEFVTVLLLVLINGVRAHVAGTRENAAPRERSGTLSDKRARTASAIPKSALDMLKQELAIAQKGCLFFKKLFHFLCVC
jgi:hypothetical protein